MEFRKWFNESFGVNLGEMASLAGFNVTDRRPYSFYTPLVQVENRKKKMVDYNIPPSEYKAYVMASSPSDALSQFRRSEDYIEIMKKKADELGIDLGKLERSLYAAEVTDDVAYFGMDTPLSKYDFNALNSSNLRRRIEEDLNNNPLDYKIKFVFGEKDWESIAPIPGIITYVKIGNAGQDILTRHMIFHTLGHAVGDASFNDKSFSDFVYGLMNELGKFFGSSGNKYTIFNTKPALLSADPMNHIDGYRSSEEFCRDLIGLIAKNGRVKVAPNKYYDESKMEKPMNQNDFNHIADLIKNECVKMLNRCVGRVIKDD
jgi:hypothetical protein